MAPGINPVFASNSYLPVNPYTLNALNFYLSTQASELQRHNYFNDTDIGKFASEVLENLTQLKEDSKESVNRLNNSKLKKIFKKSLDVLFYRSVYRDKYNNKNEVVYKDMFKMLCDHNVKYIAEYLEFNNADRGILQSIFAKTFAEKFFVYVQVPVDKYFQGK